MPKPPVFKLLLPVAVASAIVVASGYLHGLTTDRWGNPDDVRVAASKLQDVPAEFGDWSSTEVEIPQQQLEQAEAVGNLSRQYVNRLTGDSVAVLVLCGRPGPIAVHPPTVCFTAGAGLKLGADPSRHEVVSEIDGQNPSYLGSFWRGDFFRPLAATPLWMRTFWSWSPDGDWQTPDNTRMTYARNRFLYKMYVSRAMIGGSEPVDEDPCVLFLQEFIPILKNVVFSDAESEPAAPS